MLSFMISQPSILGARILTAPILIAVGANLPAAQGQSALATCRAAVEALRGLVGLRLHAVSRWYSTAPVPASDQPDYINAAVWLEGAADPANLLARLHRIEAVGGRVRGAVNAARSLDLDIIGIGGLLRAAPDPVLPHPRAHVRAFVLAPLCDIAPGWVFPGIGRSAADLLASLPAADRAGVRAML
jgi:2-amino-4-hydroxy-6-hydroxymethyldihydropteridine diphosphokinase